MALVIDNLAFAYGRIAALREVTVRAERGRVIAVLGPNASGKSTLLRCMVGALKPNVGSVHLDDVNVHRLRPSALARRIAYVPQRSIVSAAFTVRQVVELGRYALTAGPRQVNQAIAALDLDAVEHRPYRALSVGQQQRVTLARARAQLGGNESQGALVLDEPTAAMDLQHAAQAFHMLRELAATGCTVIVALHDLAMASVVSQDAWLLRDGRLVAAGPTCEVLEVSRLQGVFGVGFSWLNDRDGRPRLLADSPFAARTSTTA